MRFKSFERREDALRFERAIRRAKDLGQLAAEVAGSDQLVGEFINEWWETYATAYLRRGTLVSYAYVLDKWVVPYLGSLRLRDLSPETVDHFASTLRAAGAGVPTINRILAICQGIMARALERGRISRNPFAGRRRLPHMRDITIEARTPETVEAIRATFDPLSGRDNRALISVLAYEGLRPAEAYALEWADVLDQACLPRGRLSIRRSLSAQTVAPTKSGRGRDPQLFGPIAGELAELYLARGRPSLRELVFPDASGGHLRRQNWRQRVWIPALAAAFPCGSCDGTGRRPRISSQAKTNVESISRCEACAGHGSNFYFRPYDLRHTCATLLIYEGRTVNEVAAHLGHADPGFTARVYAHVYVDAKERRGVPIEDAIGSARSAAPAANAGGG